MKKKLLLILSLLMLILSITSCSISKDVDAESAYDSSIPKTEVVTSYSEIYKSIYPSCYGVRNIISSSTSLLGSGVIIKTDSEYSYLLTNRHVVEAADNSKISSNVSVYFGDGYYVSGKVIAATTYAQRLSDESMDLAVIRFSTPSGKNISVVTIGNDIITKGQNVLAVGCPIDLQFYNSLTVGVVEKYLPNNHLIQHQAPINHGNSGGGLFNSMGRLIGINVSKSAEDDVDCIGFAIDIPRVRSFLSDNNIEI